MYSSIQLDELSPHDSLHLASTRQSDTSVSIEPSFCCQQQKPQITVRYSLENLFIINASDSPPCLGRQSFLTHCTEKPWKCIVVNSQYFQILPLCCVLSLFLLHFPLPLLSLSLPLCVSLHLCPWTCARVFLWFTHHRRPLYSPSLCVSFYIPTSQRPL